MEPSFSSSRFAANMLPRSMVCAIADEDVFGPVVNNCLEGFDFTLLFEESILTVPLLLISLLLAISRIWYLLRVPQKVNGGILHWTKLAGFALITVFNIALVAIWARPSTPKTRFTTGTGILTLATHLVFGILSFLEHLNSIRPSGIIQFSFLLSTLFDIARVRTLWSIQENGLVAILFSISFVVKILLLVLESVQKRPYLKHAYKDSSWESTGGIFSQSLFWWMNIQLMAGYKSLLSLDDLLSVDEALCTKELEDSGLQRRWNTLSKKWSKNALLFASIQEYKWAIAAGVIPRLCQIGFVFAQPFLVRQVVLLMIEEDSRATTFAGYGLIAAYGLVYFGITVATAISQHKAFRVITMLRGALVNMIYNKTMALPSTAIGDSSPVTLMSADIERISAGLRYIYDVWAALLEIPIALWLLWGELGVASLGPIIVAIVAILLAGGLSTLAGGRQKIWLEAIEARVDATAKMLGSIKGVKLLGMTEKVYADIFGMKEIEIKKSQKFRQLLIAAAAIAYSNTALAPVISFAIYTIRANINNTETLTTAKAFTSLTLFALVNTPIGNLVESGAGLATAVGSLTRINEFLLQKPRSDGRERSTSIREKYISGSVNGDYITSSTHSSLTIAQSPRHHDEPLVARNRSAGWGNEKPSTIVNMNFDIQPSTLTIVIGPVGCGKSTLLNALLGETPEHDGYLRVTAKDVAYCGQTAWLTNKTLQQNVIGESPFDAEWYGTVIRACALGQDIDELPNGDQSIVGSKGATLSGGQKQRISLARAVYSGKSTVILDDVLSGLDSTTEEQIMTNVFGAQGIFRQSGITVIMATNNVRRIPLADHIIVLGPDGSIVQQGSFDYLNANPGYVQSLLVQEQDMQAASNSNHENILTGLSEELVETPSSDERVTGDLSVYLYYAKAIGIWRAVIFLLLMGTYVFFLSYPSIWVEKWAAVNDVTPGYNLKLYLGIYFFLAAGAMAFIVLSAWHLMANMVSKAARVFHMRLLRTVLNAPMSFFTTTDQGVTTNRFTQDLQLVDMELPLALLNTCLSSLTCLAQLIVISYSTKYLAATVPAVIAVFYFIQKFYLRTSRQLRFMDIEAKSPLFSNFLESLSGLVTIRAYGWERSYKEKNRELLEESQKPFYLLYCVQRWLEVVVGCSVAGFAVLLVGVAVATRGKIDAGFVGVALVNIVTFSENIQALIIHWTVLETSIGAVSRIRTFTMTTENENQPSEQRQPPPDWPSSGRVEFRQVFASYKKTSNPVLKGVSISIAPGEKLGICGRTGSGKSSLISTLFRTLELDNGSIFVDGIDISVLPRQDIRSRLIVIPQEPYLLRGTVRYNVDPSKLISDDAIIKALQKTQLWDVICKQGGLDANVTDDFLSHGQRQLLCLAGAILRNGTVVVLDEATSSVDSQTDELMQRVIRSEFSRHTIIAIAHRLDSILDFDKVMVLDKGSVAEVGNPNELLRPGRPGTPLSKFRALYMDANPSRILENIPEASESPDDRAADLSRVAFAIGDEREDIYDGEEERPQELPGDSTHPVTEDKIEPETPLASRKSLLDLFSSTIDELDSLRSSTTPSNSSESRHSSSHEDSLQKRNSDLIPKKSLVDLFSNLGSLDSLPATQLLSYSHNISITAPPAATAIQQDNASIISRPSDLANRPSLIDLFSSSLDALSHSSPDVSDAGSPKGKHVDRMPVRRMTLQRTVSLTRTTSVTDGPSLMHFFKTTLDGFESSGAVVGGGESSSSSRRTRAVRRW